MKNHYLTSIKNCFENSQRIKDIKVQFVKDKLMESIPRIQDFLVVLKEIVGSELFKPVFLLMNDNSLFELVIIEPDSKNKEFNVIIKLSNKIGITYAGNLILISDMNDISDFDDENTLELLSETELHNVYNSLIDVLLYIEKAYVSIDGIVQSVNNQLEYVMSSDVPFGDYLGIFENEAVEAVIDLSEANYDDVSEDDSNDDEECYDYSEPDEDDVIAVNEIRLESSQDDELSEDKYIGDESDKLQLIVSIDTIQDYKREKWKTYHEARFKIMYDGEERVASFMIGSRCCKLLHDDEILIMLEPNNHYKLYISNSKPITLSGLELKEYYYNNSI